jgi:hypothetical protein
MHTTEQYKNREKGKHQEIKEGQGEQGRINAKL